MSLDADARPFACAHPACSVICFTDTTPQSRAFSARAHEGVMLWKLTPEQLDRFLLVAAAILTVVFAVAALGLAFYVF